MAAVLGTCSEFVSMSDPEYSKCGFWLALRDLLES